MRRHEGCVSGSLRRQEVEVLLTRAFAVNLIGHSLETLGMPRLLTVSSVGSDVHRALEDHLRTHCAHLQYRTEFGWSKRAAECLSHESGESS